MALALLAFAIVIAAASRWMWLAFKLRIPENRTPFMAAWAGGVLLGLWVIVQGPTTASAIFAWPAVVLGGLLVFFALTSAQRTTARTIDVGGKLPPFSAPDENGEDFDIASLAGSPLLLKFFRGHW
jgi:hypothetical protein